MARKKVKKHLANTSVHLYILFGLSAFFFGAIAAVMVTRVIAQNNESNQIYACANNTNGELRMVEKDAECRKNENSISWSIKGPPGPPGKDGDASGSSGMPFFCSNCFFSGLGDRFAEKDFTYAQILRSDFSGEDLHGVNFEYGFISKNNFNNTNLENSSFSEMDTLQGAGYPQNNTFVNSNLKNSKFTNSILHEFDFTNADLENADFSGALLRSTNFTGALNLSTASFDSTTWENVKCPDGTNSSTNGNTCDGHF